MDLLSLLHWLLRHVLNWGKDFALDVVFNVLIPIIGLLALLSVGYLISETRNLTARKKQLELSLTLASRTLGKVGERLFAIREAEEKKLAAIREAEQEAERQRRLEIDRDIWRKRQV